jgi:hypothetical protein
MRRIRLAAAIALAAMLVPAAAHAAAGSAYLRGFACHKALDPTKRSVTVTAVMDTVAGTQQLQMRFELLERTAHGIVFIHGGDLGQWISPSSPTLGQHPSDKWVVNHPVTGVPVPGSYRFRVAFRWVGSGGHVIGQMQKATPSCWQPDMRPRLRVTVASQSAIAAGEKYDIQVENVGVTPANDVQLQFVPAAGQSQVVTIGPLGPQQTVHETVVGPSCTASNSQSTITVIDLVSRADNSITAPCPSG